jgi:hypothetical protein
MSVNDIVGLAITSDFQQSDLNLSQLDENLLQTDYVVGLKDTFMN